MTASERAQDRAVAVELQKAARNGNLRLVRQLLAKCTSPDVQDMDGWTCLHAAAVEGHTHIVRELCGEDTAAAKNGSAVRQGSGDEALLPEESADVGAELVDVNVTTGCGRTALYFATMIGNAECVRVLLHHGADPRILCKEGKAALDVAELFDRFEIRALLQAAIDNPRPPVKRRPKHALKTGDGNKRANPEPSPSCPVVAYVPPPPKEWRKSDFSKWGSITDKDLDAMDAHLEHVAQQAEAQQADARARRAIEAKVSNAGAPSEAPCARDLDYGNGRIGPPKSLPPGHPRYEEYKEWLDIQEDIARERRGEATLRDKDKLISFKPPPEGGAAPDAHNGCHGVGYTWGQSLNEVYVWVTVVQGTRSSDVACEILPASLSLAVTVDGSSRSSTALFAAASATPGKRRRDVLFKKAPLWRRIKAEESVWTLEEGLVTLTLRKVESGWWRCVVDVEGHTKIDSSLCRGPDMLDEYEGQEELELRQFFQRQLTRRL